MQCEERGGKVSVIPIGAEYEVSMRTASFASVIGSCGAAGVVKRWHNAMKSEEVVRR